MSNNKFNSGLIKAKIVEYCKLNRAHVVKQYVTSGMTDVQIDDEIYSHTLKIKSWKRIEKLKRANEIERVFDCDPLDATLRAYVRTTTDDMNLIELLVVGE